MAGVPGELLPIQSRVSVEATKLQEKNAVMTVEMPAQTKPRMPAVTMAVCVSLYMVMLPWQWFERLGIDPARSVREVLSKGGHSADENPDGCKLALGTFGEEGAWPACSPLEDIRGLGRSDSQAGQALSGTLGWLGDP